MRPEQEVEIRADAYPENTFKGRVRLISPEAVVEDNVTSFEVRLSLVTGQNKLLSGMNADLVFLGDKVDAVVVPMVAVVTQKGGTQGVYIPGEDDKPEFKPVTIGTEFEAKIQILDGVDPGERVFTELPEDIQPEGSEEE